MDKNKKNIKLTDKQERFCLEYMIDLNATQACIRAGYSQKTADRIGPELLGKTWVQARISELQKKESIKLNITREDILKEYQSIYRAEVDGFLVKNSDRLKALELTSKMLGLNEPEKIDMTTKGESIKPFEIILKSEEEKKLFESL